MQNSTDTTPPSGVVELREDIPLKAGASSGGSCGTPRLIAGCFAALSAAVTIALLTQIYYGDYQVVPHGSVSSAAEACSSAGTGALKAGGRAMDAATAASLCLALLAPHRTSIDASGSLLYWEYRNRTARAEGPTLVEWGGAAKGTPRLIVALALLHARYGALPWSEVLQPAIDLARGGFPVSKGLATAASEAGRADWIGGGVRTDYAYADFLETLQRNTSAELTALWSNDAQAVRFSSALAAPDASGWQLYAGGAGAAAAARALLAAIKIPVDADETERRLVNALVEETHTGTWPPGGVATGLAVVDPVDTYIALVTGLSVPFGTIPPWARPVAAVNVDGEGSAAFARDSPSAPIDLAPAILLNENVCGTRYVLGAESSSALAQAAAALATSTGDELGPAIERPRIGVLPNGVIALEATPPTPIPVGVTVNATLPYPAVNVVQQRGDALASHADSRSGGLSSRF